MAPTSWDYSVELQDFPLSAGFSKAASVSRIVCFPLWALLWFALEGDQDVLRLALVDLRGTRGDGCCKGSDDGETSEPVVEAGIGLSSVVDTLLWDWTTGRIQLTHIYEGGEIGRGGASLIVCGRYMNAWGSSRERKIIHEIDKVDRGCLSVRFDSLLLGSRIGRCAGLV